MGDKKTDILIAQPPGRLEAGLTDEGYRKRCAEAVEHSFESCVTAYAGQTAQARRSSRRQLEQMRDVAAEPMVKDYAAMGLAYMKLVDSLDWDDVRVTRPLVRSDKAFETIMRDAAKATRVTLEPQDHYSDLRRQVLQLYQRVKERGAVRGAMHIPAAYEGTSLYPRKNEALELNPLKPLKLDADRHRELEVLYSIKYAEQGQDTLRGGIDKYSPEYVGAMLESCHRQGIYSEFPDGDAVARLPLLRQWSVLRVMEDYADTRVNGNVTRRKDSIAIRDRAMAQHFPLSVRTFKELRNNGVNSFIARKLHQAAGGERRDAPAASEAVYTLIQPYNPVRTNAEKAESAYGMRQGEGKEYHLSRREDVMRALLHEMGHALHNDQLNKQGALHRRGGFNDTESEMISDVFASLILQDASLRTELRAIDALRTDGRYVHYTNPALSLITPDDISDAEGKNAEQIYNMACGIAKRGMEQVARETTSVTLAISDLRTVFNREFSRQLEQEEGRKIRPKEVTPEMKRMADSGVWLRTINACREDRCLTDLQLALLDEAADDVRFIQKFREGKAKGSYISDVVNTGNFAGSVPALVEMLGDQHAYALGLVRRHCNELRRILQRPDAMHAQEVAEDMLHTRAELDGLCQFSQAVRKGIRQQQAVLERVSDAESAREKK